MSYTTLEIPEKEVAQLVLQHYGITGEVKKLKGELDFNYHIKSSSGEAFNAKISRPKPDAAHISFQIALVRYLAGRNFPAQLPNPVLALNGEEYIRIAGDRLLRLQSWVPGREIAEVCPRSDDLLRQWGRLCGHFSKQLEGFSHPAAHRSYPWDPVNTLASRQYMHLFSSAKHREIAHYFWGRFEEKVRPVLGLLRKSVNYNDAHEHNLLANDRLDAPEICGVIDFGDAVYTATISELAIACAYACMEKPDPLAAASQLVAGYHEAYPLKDEELKVLYDLIAARLMITVARAANNKREEPENTYLLVSEQQAWKLLEKWRSVAPAFAYYTFRASCGWEACPANEHFLSDMARADITPVIELDEARTITLDLSIGSLSLGNNSCFNQVDRFKATIQAMLADGGALAGIGGYGEARPFYLTDNYRIEGNNGAQWRSIHLGIDIWVAVGTAIRAPLDATVHSFQDNNSDYDYGPTIILEHLLADGKKLYSLYGHLSRASLLHLEEGQAIKKGSVFAEVGDAPENGNWPPHLHFQLMHDMLGARGDFPGVAFPNEVKAWKSICPDPSVFIGITPATKPMWQAEELLALRHRHLGKNLSLSYHQPLYMLRAYMQNFYDHTGRRYLDTVNNVPHVGHQHPKVVKAAQAQVALLNTNTRYLHHNITSYAEALLATFPEELSVVFFVNSGSEANELALRMIQNYTGQSDVVALKVGYHGNTNACINVSSYKFDGKGGKGRPSNTHIVPMPDVYRGQYRDPSTAGKQYASHISEVLEQLRAEGRKVAGFICESILSCGGQIVLPENYLKEAYRIIRAEGGLCIADEVQVGFGRTGSHFWGFELQGVVPDVVTLGKPIGNGHPLAAVVTSRAVADAFANGMEYFNTFGGNPVSCAIGQAVLEVVAEEKLQENARLTGEYVIAGLKKLQQKHPIIGDVRGKGLFLGIELVRNKTTLEPAAEEATYLINRMRARAILMSTDGPLHNVIKIKPPLCFSKADADYLLQHLDMVLSEDFLRMA
jgi:4-aminobutyrate aminotransferase-like enzyme/Ser/Thr protein kinase RdoA (MazF antagonist)